MENIVKEQMYVLVAPEGSPQPTFMAHDYEMVFGMAILFSQSGMGKPASQLIKEGYEVIPVEVSIIQTGTAEEGFQKAKASLTT